MNNLDTLAAFGQSLFKAILERMDVALTVGDYEGALRWGTVGAWLLATHGSFGELASAELEERLLSVAARLPSPEWKPGPVSPKRVLHVMTLAYRIFGHTTLCRKWIELDSPDSLHDVILLGQEIEVPENLREVVEGQGGRIICLDPADTLLNRAQALRRVACEVADLVVIHTHPDDVIATVAFGSPGGPPVMFENHADHLFWAGGAVADIVLNIRDSASVWTKVHRGIERTTVLPIPLRSEVDSTRDPAIRSSTRKGLGIPEDAVVFLTVGNAKKYLPMPGLSFLDAATGILESGPNNWIVAVGPELVDAWEQVSKKFKGRLIAVGNQDDLVPFHSAADVYLEGIPLGSLTALLEAGLAGLPCVRTPAPMKPPLVSDDPAFDAHRPDDVAAYVKTADGLANDRSERLRQGEAQRDRILKVHCKGGWNSRLKHIIESLDKVHSIYPEMKPKRLKKEDRDFWLNYLHGGDGVRAEARILGGVVHAAVRNCPDSRRNVEQAFLGKGPCFGEEVELKQRIVTAIFPKAGRADGELFSSVEDPDVELTMVFQDLITRSMVDLGPLGSRLLAVRVCLKQPSLLRNRSFVRSGFKVLAGLNAVKVIRRLRSKQGRR